MWARHCSTARCMHFTIKSQSQLDIALYPLDKWCHIPRIDCCRVPHCACTALYKMHSSSHWKGAARSKKTRKCPRSWRSLPRGHSFLPPCHPPSWVAFSTLAGTKGERKHSKHATNSCNSTHTWRILKFLRQLIREAINLDTKVIWWLLGKVSQGPFKLSSRIRTPSGWNQSRVGSINILRNHGESLVCLND